jgi:hypothetical protein
MQADYFSFSYLSENRKDIYSKYFDKEFMDDYINNNVDDSNNDDSDNEDNVEDKNNYQKFKEYIVNKLNRLQFGLPSCLQYLNYLGGKTDAIRHQKENGQYVVPGNSSENEIVNRDYSVLPIQYNYYEKIIKLCESKGIDLYVVMAPLQEGETASHTESERDEFNDMITKSLEGTPFKGHYINYSKENGLSPYTDFADSTHLTVEASDRYSEWLNSRIFGE